MKYRIADLLWLTLVVALCLTIWKQQRQIDVLIVSDRTNMRDISALRGDVWKLEKELWDYSIRVNWHYQENER